MSRGTAPTGWSPRCVANICMMRKPAIPNSYNRRIRLSSREILLAVAVTVAAIVFATAAARHVAGPPLAREQANAAP